MKGCGEDVVGNVRPLQVVDTIDRIPIDRVVGQNGRLADRIIAIPLSRRPGMMRGGPHTQNIQTATKSHTRLIAVSTNDGQSRGPALQPSADLLVRDAQGHHRRIRADRILRSVSIRETGGITWVWIRLLSEPGN